MNGFVGMDPNRAMQDITVFAQAMHSISDTMRKAGALFFENLANNWYSPNAVEFSNNFSGILYDNTVTIIERNADIIIAAAVDSFNQMSQANGGPTIPPYDHDTPSNQYNFGSLRESGVNGIGMNAAGVKQALSEYYRYINTGLSALDSVPTNLALYDQTGNIRVTFQNCVAKIKEVVNSAVNDVATHLNSIIDNEVNKLNSATQNSAQAIANAGSSTLSHL
jgi:hypothetical protein